MYANLVYSSAPPVHASVCLSIDKGVAKIARQLGFDYAEAVVRTPSCSPKLAVAILSHAWATMGADKLRIPEGQGVPRNFGYCCSCGE